MNPRPTLLRTVAGSTRLLVFNALAWEFGIFVYDIFFKDLKENSVEQDGRSSWSSDR